jgi:ketosteroid isomerase-like protein
MQSKTETLISAYEAFNARNIEAVLAMMLPDVDWPNGMEGGRVLGKENVRAYWKRQWEVVDPRVEPESFDCEDSGRVVVRVHQVVRDLAGNVLLDHMVGHAYSFKDGLIACMDILGAD